MSVKKTAQGTYRARLRDSAGASIGKTFARAADAHAWERDQLRHREQGLTSNAGRITFATWCDTWLESSRHLSDGTAATYRRDLDRYILPVLGDIPLGRLTADHIDGYLNTVAGQFAPSSVHRHYRTIHRALAVAVERRRLAYNPATPVQPPKVTHAEMRFLTAAQVDLLADAVSDRYRAWVLVAGWGGLRWGELRALEPGDVVGDRVAVHQQLDGAKLKTAASVRNVKLPGSVADILTDHLDRFSTVDLVFPTGRGGPMSHASFSGNVFKPSLVRAGLDRDTRIHDLRHTAAALAIAAGPGCHPKVLQMRLGHASISITLDRYGHLFPGHDDGLADDLDRLRLGVSGTVPT
jgi:integrase